MEKFSTLNEPLRVVVFCGGFGTRMWPMSRMSYPKQFQPLIGEKSFFRDTIDRLEISFKPKDIFIAVPREQTNFVKEQAPEIPDSNIIVEPERRDTLGAVSYSAAFIDKLFPGSLLAMVWGSDHLVKDKKKFNKLIRAAAAVCQEKNVICKVDVKPTYPATDLGWLKIGKQIGETDGFPVFSFEKFIEKPDLETAKKLFEDKNYLINTGYFVARTSVFLDLLQKYNRDCYEIILKIKEAIGTKKENEVLKKEYAKIEKTSFDYGLFEKLPSDSANAIQADFGWFDVGTWDLLYQSLSAGPKDNVIKGDIFALQSEGNVFYLPKGKMAVAIGVEDMIIVDTPDALLICKRGRSKEVKEALNELKEKGKIKYL